MVGSVVALLACASPAGAHTRWRPRIKGLMGIVPPAGHQDTATGTNIPVVFHGGEVMHHVTVHTVWWAPSGFHFDGSPSAGVLGYRPLIDQFFTDVAHDSGSTGNEFSTLTEYPDRSSAHYRIAYNAASDSITDTDPYPPASKQCPSPAGVPTCVTDLQIDRELEKLIDARDPSGHGLHDLWFVFLPPDVDTCDALGDCGTTAFAGYHSLSNLGHGPNIYAVVPDPLIEFAPPPGADPEGNPEAESSIDTAAHETVEAMTDPEGTGWMDPNGYEVADKCEFPEYGTPLGYAPDGSPYNEVINGHEYLSQEMWSNARNGCEQHSTSTSSSLPLARVTLRQFSPSVSGNIGFGRGGVPVQVALIRGAGDIEGLASTRTRANGSWGPVDLEGPRGVVHAPGDDRDVVVVRYGAGGPKPDVIATGSGGNPFTLSGWTGWFDLDNGYRVQSHSVQVSPCFQNGVLGVDVGGHTTAPPVSLCAGETDVATVQTPAVTPRTRVTISSEDNRAVTIDNPSGALIKLIVPAGEPNSVSALGNGQILLAPSGFPSCTADLRAQTVRCSGLHPGSTYKVWNRTAAAGADADGVARFAAFAHPIRGGEVLTLQNGVGRVLTRLHVAHLRVDIRGTRTVVAGGSCQPGDYYGRPLSRPPISGAIGLGIAGEGTLCPDNGDASGLSALHIEQTDDLSGGQTVTQVPEIDHITPADGDTVYGRFIAFARSDLPAPQGSSFATGARISLTVMADGSKRALVHERDVEDRRGVGIRSLPRGAYVAKWVMTDANGDTRTIETQFAEER